MIIKSYATIAIVLEHLLKLRCVHINQMAKYINILQDNSYYGAIDPAPYWSGGSAKPLFLKDMAYGERSEEVRKLQEYLSSQGYFWVEPTGFYGDITAKAVLEYQVNNINLSWWERYVLKGKRVGPKTRASLNS